MFCEASKASAGVGLLLIVVIAGAGIWGKITQHCRPGCYVCCITFNYQDSLETSQTFILNLKRYNQLPTIIIRSPQSQNIMSSQQESSFNILGSSKLNTADGKNPTSTTTTSTSHGTASGQKNNDAYRKECQSAHDALENKLRDEEREKKWTGNW